MSKGEVPDFSVILVDDNKDNLKRLKISLEALGCDVRIAFDGVHAKKMCYTYRPDLLITEISLDGVDGITLCHELRRDNQFDEMAIVMLTNRAEEYTEVAAFEAGADDYLVKPLRRQAFFRRVKRLRDRHKQLRVGEKSILDYGRIKIDKDNLTVHVGELIIELPKKTFELLFFLANHQNVVFEREELLRQIWAQDRTISPRTIDVHIRKIRERTGEELITTIKGIGYKFSPAHLPNINVST